MYRIFQRLTPAFLRKLDHELLISRPGLWATRLHYLLFYWLIGAGLASILLMLMPIQFNEVPRGENSTVMMMIVSAIALIAWAVQLAHYQPWKQGESHWRLHALRDQGIYALGVGLLLMLPLGFFMLHTQRLDNAIADAELARETEMIENVNTFLFNDLETLAILTEKGDFVLKEGQSKRDLLIEYQSLAAKYGPRDMVYSLDINKILDLHAEGKKPYHEMHLLREINYKVEDNLYALRTAERPVLRSDMDRKITIGIWASLVILLLLFVRSSWQTFLLSVVSGFGLFLFNGMAFGLAIASGIVHDDESLFLVLLFINAIVLGGMAFLGEVKSKRQQQVRMMALSLFTVLISIIPSIFGGVVLNASDREMTTIYLISCGITLLLWNLFLQGRMLQLVVSPKRQ